jgi:flagellar capping protein FliD
MESFNITGNSRYTSLAQIGIKTNTTTGRYELDKEKLEDALKDNFDEIVSMFVKEGYTDNSSVAFGRSNDETEEGVYNLVEQTDGTYTMTVDGGDGTTYTASRDGDIISFDSGPAKGLFLTAPSGSGDTKVTFSKGLAGRLNDVVDGLTDPDIGTLAAKTKSMNNRIKSFADQAEAMERRVNSYHDRLVKQFAAMEQSISSLRSQSSAMYSQLGFQN